MSYLIFIMSHLAFCLSSSESSDEKETFKHISTPEYILYGLLSMACILFSGVMAGLTMGLLGINQLELKLLASNGSTTEKTWAKQVLAIVSHHHLVLVTLLLAYTISVEAFPLFLHKMFSKEVDVFISITLVLIFGEILPHAVLIGKNRLQLAAKLIPTVKVLLVVFLPLSYPIAKILDWVIGSHSSRFLKNQELKTFLALNEDEKDEKTLEKSQVDVLHSIIDLKTAKIKDFLKPFKEFLKISVFEPVDQHIMAKIAKAGQSQAFLYQGDKRNVVGVMDVKELFKLWQGDQIQGSDVKYLEPVFISEKISVIEAVQTLAGQTLALVVSAKEPGNVIKGVFSLESVFGYLFRENSLLIDEQLRKISNALIGTLATPKGKSRPASFYWESLL